MRNPGVGDVLEGLLEHDVLNIDQLIFISRWFPPLEIMLAIFALTGIFAALFSRFMALLYLFFAVLILYVSEGFLLLPIDCGCFGEGNQTPAYLLIMRNVFIALPLIFFPKPVGYLKRPHFLLLQSTTNGF
ncbi:MAG: hypothetical protein KQH63_14745 [Desulfobulbaceae bacterium]|nr:hypothetical protein [Desulfobulbaceae bacterium]